MTKHKKTDRKYDKRQKDKTVLVSQNQLESQRFLVHMFSLNKSVRRDSPTYSSGANYWPPAKNCWTDLLGRSDPHHMLNSMQDKRRANMSQKIARDN